MDNLLTKAYCSFSPRCKGKREAYKLIAHLCVFAPLRDKILGKHSYFAIFVCVFLLFFISVFPIGSDTLSLDETLKTLGGMVEFHWDPFFSSGTFIDGRHQAAFISGKAGDTGMVLFDYRDVFTLPAAGQ